MSLGDAEAAGRVLAVDRHEIELPDGSQPRQPVDDCRTPAAANNIANKQDAHASRRSAVGSRAISPGPRRLERGPLSKTLNQDFVFSNRTAEIFMAG